LRVNKFSLITLLSCSPDGIYSSDNALIYFVTASIPLFYKRIESAPIFTIESYRYCYLSKSGLSFISADVPSPIFLTYQLIYALLGISSV
jgi:hypothetical protein